MAANPRVIQESMYIEESTEGVLLNLARRLSTDQLLALPPLGVPRAVLERIERVEAASRASRFDNPVAAEMPEEHETLRTLAADAGAALTGLSAVERTMAQARWVSDDQRKRGDAAPATINSTVCITSCSQEVFCCPDFPSTPRLNARIPASAP